MQASLMVSLWSMMILLILLLYYIRFAQEAATQETFLMPLSENDQKTLNACRLVVASFPGAMLIFSGIWAGHLLNNSFLGIVFGLVCSWVALVFTGILIQTIFPSRKFEEDSRKASSFNSPLDQLLEMLLGYGKSFRETFWGKDKEKRYQDLESFRGIREGLRVLRREISSHKRFPRTREGARLFLDQAERELLGEFARDLGNANEHVRKGARSALLIFSGSPKIEDKVERLVGEYVRDCSECPSGSPLFPKEVNQMIRIAHAVKKSVDVISSPAEE